ncbi:phage tail protein [Dyella sp. M7H15-1]|uniref:phage tail sheath C-terminal domain-containing protein n=1 Tax=Dyella sp. M7H15-1 TaxID=2501295 RepID=UPI001004E12F|nr:phage tail sheath C-terminal domain-containing protein [Dyella sp. M7H15-1]QAU22593.1 phage tail protein [Dyella sp. M7H15-1]
MSQIVQQGQINTTALVVPDLYVQIIPPAISQLNGVPSNVLGIVGTAPWGPVGAPVVFGNMAQYWQNFGNIQNRKYDMGTAVAAAVLQGANNFRGVRVTDGTDTAATATLKDATSAIGLTLTSTYTGSLANGDIVTIAIGTQANSWKLVLARPGMTPEVFDNIGGGASPVVGAALWAALANAVNHGVAGIRGPSGLMVAAVGPSTAAPVVSAATLAGGADGATTINGTVLLGVDGNTRKGMYALRSAGCAVAVLTDCDDSTTYAAQIAFGLSEGIDMIAVTPAGDTPANAATTKSTAGIDAYDLKLLLGDWVYWNDTVNGLVRMISPQGFVAGLLANLAPQYSALNKPISGIVGTQRSYANNPYSSAELQVLGQAGVDVIANPCPGGSFFGCRFGHNSSSNAAINGDNYTRMTNYLGATFAAGMGQFVGRLQSTQQNDPTRRGVNATLSNFLQNMQQQGQIDSFSVQCDLNNNPPSRIAAGYLQADVAVKYLSVVEKFLVNLQGGQTVSVTKVSTQYP